MQGRFLINDVDRIVTIVSAGAYIFCPEMAELPIMLDDPIRMLEIGLNVQQPRDMVIVTFGLSMLHLR